MAKLEIGENVQLRPQEDRTLCGEAVAQMTLAGSPDRAGRTRHSQNELKGIIEAANNNPANGIRWGTSPDGMTACLRKFSLASADWVQSSNDTRVDALLFLVLGMMAHRYPTPVVVDQGRHWVVVVGWETEHLPQSGTNPVLQYIHYLDPEPANIGSEHLVEGVTWNRRHWRKAIIAPGKWIGKYVVIGQPPAPDR